MNPDLQFVLDWVNEVRAARGLGPALDELPTGQQSKDCRCVVANALNGASCTYTSVVFDGEHTADYIPWGIGHFMLDFDNGKYPELIEA